jgi:hypothetical protein
VENPGNSDEEQVIDGIYDDLWCSTPQNMLLRLLRTDRNRFWSTPISSHI